MTHGGVDWQDRCPCHFCDRAHRSKQKDRRSHPHSPSLAIHCSVAARGVEPARPTPIPSKTACVARTPRRCEDRSLCIRRRARVPLSGAVIHALSARPPATAVRERAKRARTNTSTAVRKRAKCERGSLLRDRCSGYFIKVFDALPQQAVRVRVFRMMGLTGHCRGCPGKNGTWCAWRRGSA